MIIGPHPSHVTRMSDASTFDEICVNCGATDEVPGGWGLLAQPCPNPPKKVCGVNWCVAYAADNLDYCIHHHRRPNLRPRLLEKREVVQQQLTEARYDGDWKRVYDLADQLKY